MIITELSLSNFLYTFKNNEILIHIKWGYKNEFEAKFTC